MKKTALAVLAAVVLVAAPMSSSAATSRTKTTHVRVIMGHPSVFEFVLSKRRVPKGRVIFTLVNRGQIAHDFAIDRKKSKMIQPGSTDPRDLRGVRLGRQGGAGTDRAGWLPVRSVPAPNHTGRVQARTVFVGAGARSGSGLAGQAGAPPRADRWIQVQPGKTGSLTIVFRKAGRYPYKCTVPGHAEAGMKGFLSVR